jgi:dTDP-4-amino-4,6-dideoxygalactose transaminase
MIKIGFNKPYLTGRETEYITDAISSAKISGNGKYTQLCHKYFEEHYGFKKCLLTSSCTDALEMSAILIDIQEGDEVIMPSYTFVSTANAFVLRGAKIIFADSESAQPNLDAEKIEALISPKTKAIVVVHYAGVACDMDKIMSIANKHNLFVIEDAAQAIDSFYTNSSGNKIPLGSMGHLSAFSFHETKNVISGEGGMLVVNDDRFVKRAEIIWEKGTNRSAFFRGEVDKYGWVDIGSSFLPSDIIAAFLFAQLENLPKIQEKRLHIWNRYANNLKGLSEAGKLKLPVIPDYASNNAHMFYINCNSLKERTDLIEYLKEHGVNAVFHYLSLHASPYYGSKHNGEALPNCDSFADTLVRLPFFFELQDEQIDYISDLLKSYFK